MLNELLQLLLILTVILVVAKLAGSLSKRIGQPSVFGELLVGLILGPTAVNLLNLPAFSHGEGIQVVLSSLAELGVIVLMFLAGVETDLKAMRQVGWSAFLGALGGVALPLAGGTGISLLYGFPLMEAVFIGTVLTATSVSISAQTLMELNVLKSKEGTTLLGAAVIDDIMGIIVLSLVVALSGAQGAADVSLLPVIGSIILRIVAFFIIAVFVLGRFIQQLLDWVVNKLHTTESLTAMVLALMFIYAWAAEYIGGVAAITGSYLLGVLIGQSSFRHEVEGRLHTIAYGLLVPVFLVNIGLQANGRELLGPQFMLTVWIVAIAIITKVVGAGLGVLVTGFRPMEAARVGIGMISRGEVALIVSAIGLRAGVIGESVFSIMVVMTLMTTLITPVLLRLVFPASAMYREREGKQAYE